MYLDIDSLNSSVVPSSVSVFTPKIVSANNFLFFKYKFYLFIFIPYEILKELWNIIEQIGSSFFLIFSKAWFACFENILTKPSKLFWRKAGAINFLCFFHIGTKYVIISLVLYLIVNPYVIPGAVNNPSPIAGLKKL